MYSECTLTVCAKLCQIAQGWVTICPCVLHPPFVHTNYLVFSSAKGVHTREEITGNTFPETIVRLASPPPPISMLGEEFARRQPPRENNLSNIEMGGRGAGTLVRDQRGLRLEDYE